MQRMVNMDYTSYLMEYLKQENDDFNLDTIYQYITSTNQRQLEVFYNNEIFFNDFYNSKAWELVKALSSGDYRLTDKFLIIFNDCIKSSDDIWDLISIKDIANYLEGKKYKFKEWQETL